MESSNGKMETWDDVQGRVADRIAKLSEEFDRPEDMFHDMGYSTAGLPVWVDYPSFVVGFLFAAVVGDTIGEGVV